MILIYGGKGWIGTMICEYLKEMGKDYYSSKLRVDNVSAVENELDELKPTHVLSVIGRTHGEGHSTIDYLEQDGKLKENINDNLFCPISLSLLCKARDIHFTYLGTGCIFSENSEKIECSNGFDENSEPNFFGSSYSIVKGFTDRIMHCLSDSVLNNRIRMPIVGYDHPRNFITKIKSYDKVINIHNSMTVLPDLLPVLLNMMEKKKIGTVNLVNPGTVSHNDILDLYTKIVDNSFSYCNFTIEEQNQILKSERSNNKLNTSELSSEYPHINHIKLSIENMFMTWNKSYKT